MEEQIKKVIEEDIRPALRADGGNIAFVALTEDGVVKVELQGACKGCPGAKMTLQLGVERILKEKVPGVTGVAAV